MVQLPDVRVGEPIRFGGISLFPLSSGASLFPGRNVDYVLSHEAMERGTVTVTEASEKGVVSELLVRNDGEPVLFLEGSELRGARQNRAINTTMLVAGRSETVIPVSCVERRRWTESCGHFRPGSHSPPSLRHVLKEGWIPGRRKLGHRQSAVWAEIRRKHATLNVSSETEDMGAALEARRKQVEEMQEQFAYPTPANGIALVLGDSLICIDILDKAATLEKIWGRFREGLLVDLLEFSGPAEDIGVTEIAAKVNHMTHHLPWFQAEPVGLGEQFRAHDDTMLAAALVVDGTVIHTSATMPR